jgi:hypothetical protein
MWFLTLLQEGIARHVRETIELGAPIQEIVVLELGEEGLDEGDVADLDGDFFKNGVVRETGPGNAALLKQGVVYRERAYKHVPHARAHTRHTHETALAVEWR